MGADSGPLPGQSPEWLRTVNPDQQIRVMDAMVTIPKTHDSSTSVVQIRRFFEDDHVHLALIIGAGDKLLTTLERTDIPSNVSGSSPACQFGTLVGRTIPAHLPLDIATAVLRSGRLRRLAVIDDQGCLSGLLCLKRSGDGYCTDDGVQSRAEQCRKSASPATSE
jgi:hypothetical protein